MAEPDAKVACKANFLGSLAEREVIPASFFPSCFAGLPRLLQSMMRLTCRYCPDAFEKAETAYKAVMKPKEGTILTVAKGMAVRAVELERGGRRPICLRSARKSSKRAIMSLA